MSLNKTLKGVRSPHVRVVLLASLFASKPVHQGSQPPNSPARDEVEEPARNDVTTVANAVSGVLSGMSEDWTEASQSLILDQHAAVRLLDGHQVPGTKHVSSATQDETTLESHASERDVTALVHANVNSKQITVSVPKDHCDQDRASLAHTFSFNGVYHHRLDIAVAAASGNARSASVPDQLVSAACTSSAAAALHSSVGGITTPGAGIAPVHSSGDQVKSVSDSVSMFREHIAPCLPALIAGRNFTVVSVSSAASSASSPLLPARGLADITCRTLLRVLASLNRDGTGLKSTSTTLASPSASSPSRWTYRLHAALMEIRFDTLYDLAASSAPDFPSSMDVSDLSDSSGVKYYPIATPQDLRSLLCSHRDGDMSSRASVPSSDARLHHRTERTILSFRITAHRKHSDRAPRGDRTEAAPGSPRSPSTADRTDTVFSYAKFVILSASGDDASPSPTSANAVPRSV